MITFFITAGFAQDYKSEVSIQGTVNIPKNSDNLDIPHEATKSGGFLAGYRLHLNRWFAVQGDYGYTRDTQKYLDPVFGETEIQANVHQLTGEAVITAPSSSRVRPYALAGVGGLFFRPTNSLNNSFVGVGVGSGNNQTKAAFVYGGGVDFDLTKFVALRAEYRGLLYKIPDFQLTGLATDNYTHMAEPSVGLVWRF
ncbi:MAG TPA: porin family protein [Candidatus Angelobacter sp.]|nr:porin family protein [Candidatus Angelobacter sp.]